ncbi:transposase [Candidatus Thiosymbion oneisti]|uniref:transposase n=1 Tax=Candidatus Thiosymbion oneisti TaxID=589554 RepID=UPI000A95F1C7|nr:transposase [Candidatus Thiosymbion oneisti]
MSTSILDSNMTSEKTQSPVRYPSDLIDEEWEILQSIFEELEPYTTGRPRTTDLREILNAIFYLNKTGCPWRYLPTDFPPYQLVNDYYNKWTDNRTLEKVNTALRQHLREKKAEIQTQRQPSLIVKASRELQNPIWNQGSMEASSLTEEKEMSLSIQWVV